MKTMRLLIVLFLLPAAYGAAAPQAELWPRREAHNPASSTSVDHDDWGAFFDYEYDWSLNEP